MSDSDLTAFAALQELARLTGICREIQENAPRLKQGAEAYRRTAAQGQLQRPRTALERAAGAMDDASEALNHVLSVIHEEGKVLEERLTAVAVKQADLDEIHKRRTEEKKQGDQKKPDEKPRMTISNGGVWVMMDNSGTAKT